MIREERDPAFWDRIASHPAVEHIKRGLPLDLGELAQHERVVPLASEHGGFLLFQLDGLGRIYEMHTLFTPEGWGREVNRAGKAMLNRMFETAEIITTYEGYPPPKSFGWRTAGDFKDSDIGRVRTWFLTREAWEASPARRRQCQ